MTSRNRPFEEFQRIIQLVKATPRAGKDIVDKFHSIIIHSLDSGEVIQIPSKDHRDLHEVIWLTAFMVYNGYESSTEAYDAFDRPTYHTDLGCLISERERFDIWYAKNYTCATPIDVWAEITRNGADRESRLRTNRSLEEVSVMV